MRKKGPVSNFGNHVFYRATRLFVTFIMLPRSLYSFIKIIPFTLLLILVIELLNSFIS